MDRYDSDFSEGDDSDDNGNKVRTSSIASSAVSSAPSSAAPPPPPGPPPPAPPSYPPPIQDDEDVIAHKKKTARLPPSLEKKKWIPPRHRGVSVGTLARERYKNMRKPQDQLSQRSSTDHDSEFDGKKRAIQAFNLNASMDGSNEGDMRERRLSSMDEGSMIELQKQHLRGIFAAACTDHTDRNGEMRLNSKNLKEAVIMTGLYPSKRLLQLFFEANNTSISLPRFLEVVLENLAIDADDDMKEPDMEDHLVELFAMFDEDKAGTMRIKDLRHLMMEVLTSDKTELSRAEFDEFLEYAGLHGDAEIDYKVLAKNFMLSNPTPCDIIIGK